MTHAPRTLDTLFPLAGPITFVSRRADEACPFCGESRVTDQIHGSMTFLCGASGRLGREKTKCEGGRFLPFVEEGTVG